MRFSSRRELAVFLMAPLVAGTVLIKLRNLVSLGGPRRSTGGAQVRGKMVFTMLLQAVLFFVVGGFGYALWHYLVLVVLPFATIFLFLSRLRMFLEHAPLHPDAGPLSRSITGRNVSSLLLSGCNFRYHNDHHRYPQLPGVHLPGLRALRGAPEEAREMTASYLQPLGTHWQSLR